MAVVQFGDEGEPNMAKPVRRTTRWATQRKPAQAGLKKRVSIMDRLHRRTSKAGAHRKSASSSLRSAAVGADAPEESDTRRIYFNVPIPPEERDEEGRIRAKYVRNKIRTAKYTPLSFVPKNLWFQFHNIANIYFLFTVILSVSAFFFFLLSYPANTTLSES
jgi:phospholipid-translocating ATPase